MNLSVAYTECEKAWGGSEDWQKVNALCIVDQDHQKCAMV